MAISIEELQAKVTELSPEEFTRFREWLDEYMAQVWDRQFETDVSNGKLDALGKEALEALRNGKCSKL